MAPTATHDRTSAATAPGQGAGARRPEARAAPRLGTHGSGTVVLVERATGIEPA